MCTHNNGKRTWLLRAAELFCTCASQSHLFAPLVVRVVVEGKRRIQVSRSPIFPSFSQIGSSALSSDGSPWIQGVWFALAVILALSPDRRTETFVNYYNMSSTCPRAIQSCHNFNPWSPYHVTSFNTIGTNRSIAHQSVPKLLLAKTAGIAC